MDLKHKESRLYLNLKILSTKDQVAERLLGPDQGPADLGELQMRDTGDMQ